jgi:hypothetical protein
MAALSLALYRERYPGAPLAERPPDPELLALIREWQARQYRPRCVRATVRYWLSSLGGKPEYAPARLRLPDSEDPHLLCFGPRPNTRFPLYFRRAHAAVPYRLERGEGVCRIYVYDPDYPRDSGRRVTFRRGGTEFEYGRISSREGWGIVLVPPSAIQVTKRR